LDDRFIAAGNHSDVADRLRYQAIELVFLAVPNCRFGFAFLSYCLHVRFRLFQSVRARGQGRERWLRCGEVRVPFHGGDNLPHEGDFVSNRYTRKV
jgi:hypothetical protein